MWRSPSSPQEHQKYIYMWNNSYRTPTEHWQKTSDLPKGKKLPHIPGQGKRKNRDKRIGTGPAPLGRSCGGGKVSTHQETPSRAETWAGWGLDSLEPWRRAQQQGCRGQSGEISTLRIGANQYSPAREACLLTRRGGRGLGAEARALEVRPQGEDWGWLCEHSLRGLVRHSQLGGSPGKSLDLLKRQETIVSWCARRGDSDHHLNELQRQA